MAHLALTFKAASTAYKLLAESHDVDWDTLARQRGSGTPLDFSELESMLDELCDEFSAPLSDGLAAEFEGRVGVLLHQSVSNPAAIIDPDFWRWVAFRPALRTVLHRHQTSKHEMPKGANFGLGSPIENFPFRAWTRAAIAFAPEASVALRYSLALRGDQDFWRSHLLRQRYTYSRAVAHALIRFQYPDVAVRPTLAPGDHPNGIRMLAKRLKRFQANCVLTLLTEDQCWKLLDMLAQGLVRSDGSTYQSTGRA